MDQQSACERISHGVLEIKGDQSILSLGIDFVQVVSLLRMRKSNNRKHSHWKRDDRASPMKRKVASGGQFQSANRWNLPVLAPVFTKLVDSSAGEVCHHFQQS